MVVRRRGQRRRRRPPPPPAPASPPPPSPPPPRPPPATDTTGGGWALVGEAVGADCGERCSDGSGAAVALSEDGTRLIVGERFDDGEGENEGVNRGRARVFEFNKTGTSAWDQVGDDIVGDGPLDHMGTAVAISDNGGMVAVGAPFAGGDDAGMVRVFEETPGGSWSKVDDDLVGDAPGVWFGASIALSTVDDTTLAVSGVRRDAASNVASGLVRVYWLRPNYGWEREGSDIEDDAPGDASGRSLDLSDDGLRLAVGSPFSDTNGEASGRARVFLQDLDLNVWHLLGYPINGTAAGDHAGEAVALSGDGNTLVVGSPGALDGAGRVETYEWDETNSVWTPWVLFAATLPVTGSAARCRSPQTARDSPSARRGSRRSPALARVRRGCTTGPDLGLRGLPQEWPFTEMLPRARRAPPSTCRRMAIHSPSERSERTAMDRFACTSGSTPPRGCRARPRPLQIRRRVPRQCRALSRRRVRHLLFLRYRHRRWRKFGTNSAMTSTETPRMMDSARRCPSPATACTSRWGVRRQRGTLVARGCIAGHPPLGIKSAPTWARTIPHLGG